MEAAYFTHRVAVIAYLVQGDKFLLLKRNTYPYIWAPPGGHLNRNEPPEAGLKREVLEETGLEIDVVAPVNTWFGDWNGQPLLSIDYLGRIVGGNLRLSAEHSAYAWVSVEDLRRGKPIALNPRLGFTLRDFEKAAELITVLRKARYHI